MKISRATILSFMVILLSFAVGIFYYPELPDQIASHWGANGEANGYMPKFWGTFFVPFLMLGMFFFFKAIPFIDPKRENIQSFRRTFDSFIVVFLLFFHYIFWLTIFWNLGNRLNLMQWMSPAIGLLFFYIGVLISRAKMNWFIGIRTPWTLSSETVWNKTHAIGGKLFEASGIIVLLGFIFPDLTLLFLLGPIIFTSIFTTAYSYYLYHFETTSNKK
jgi:uncharacterized membrane protein